jgi:sugar lactone lactonase YvrE
MRPLVAISFVAALFAACARQEKAATTDTTKTSAAGATLTTPLGETANLQAPESVRYDPELDVFYISNINGNPAQKDGNGFIAVVRADSIGAPPKMLAEGGKNGAKLDAPKGLALVGDTLWVTDLDHVRAFNRRTGAPIADIDLTAQKATFLNDIAVGGDGAIYVTDSGVSMDAKGNMSHPGKDQIFKISGRTVTVVTPDSLATPNGITWDRANARFILAAMGGTAVQTWKPGDKAAATLVNGPGQYDGVEVLGDGRILVTSWADSTVNVIQNGALSKLITGQSGPADIGVDTKRMVLAIPRLTDNKVVYYKLP